MRRSDALTAGVWIAIVSLLLASCGGAAQEDSRVVSLGSLVAPTATAPRLETPSETAPAPTERPNPDAPTPDTLDRQLEDSADMRQRRDALVDMWVRAAVSDQDVLAAMRAVPRHAFVPTQYLEMAYNDHPLPIGHGQTISQPSLVGMMTALLAIDLGDRVLEIGTGSGYQAALLRELTDEVYTIEIIPQLAGTARRIFDELGYGDIHTLRADGYYGWEEYAPFDAIIVTAAPDHLPAPLVAQLNPDGGRMVIPMGPPGGYQSLWLVQRQGDDVEMERLLDVMFVPFTRETDE